MVFTLPYAPVMFEIADDWLAEAGVRAFELTTQSFSASVDPRARGYPLKVIPFEQIQPPQRLAGVTTFDRARMVRILKGFVVADALPAVLGHELPTPCATAMAFAT